jgi:hypothetical protein
MLSPLSYGGWRCCTAGQTLFLTVFDLWKTPSRRVDPAKIPRDSAARGDTGPDSATPAGTSAALASKSSTQRWWVTA